MFRPLAAAVCLIVCAHMPASAQAGAAADLIADLDRFRMAMTDAHKYIQANRNIEALDRTRPGIMAKTQPDSALVLSGARGPYVNLSELARTERNILGDPLLRNAIHDAGLTPRQYVLANWVVFFQGVVGFMGVSGAQAQKIYEQAHIDPSNITFLKKNRAQLEAHSGRVH